MEKKHQKTLSIAMFGQRAPDDPSGGGIEVVATELSTRMAALGHKITCYNRSDNQIKKTERTKKYNGIREKYVPTLKAKGLAAVSSSFFAAIACAFGKYDVVHIHAEGPATMCWIPKLFGKRVVVTVHGLDWQREKWAKGFASKYIKFGERCMVKYADQIIVLSQSVKQYFKDTYGRNTQYIPNGVNRHEIIPAELISKKYKLRKDDYILFVGRLVPEKGLSYLIESFKQIETDKRLVITGGSSDTDDFVQKIQKMASDDPRIVFTGLVRGQTLQELYSNAYIYCLPSDLEGMPLTLLEAMSYGNCCLISDINECVDVVRDRACTFQKSNVLDLKKKLLYLLENKDVVQNYKARAADDICEKYAWSNVVDKTLGLYRGE